MFKRKKSSIKCSVKLLDRQRNILFQDFLENLVLSEEAMIQKSIEFFQDPAPCYLHKGAVAIRLLSEIECRMKEFPQNNLIQIKSDDKINRYTEFSAVYFIWEEK